MAIVTTDNQYYTDIAAAIRSKNGTETLYKPSEMAAAIQAISGGGGSDIGEGKYLCRVIDYDGTVLLEKRGNNGDTVTLPTPPIHDRLVFQGWSCSQAVVDNTVTFSDNNISVGAMYETASGKTEFDITLTRVTGLTVTFQNMTGVTKIDWGDGTTDTTLTHTYENYGNYTILISDVTSFGQYIFSQTSSTINYSCTAARLGQSVMNIGEYALRYCCSLISVTIPQSVTSIGGYAFAYCYSLISVTIPQGVTNVSDGIFYYCYSLISVTIPQGATNIYAYVFTYCYSLISVTIPQGVTSIYSNTFAYCYSLTSVIIPRGVTAISTYMFKDCQSIMVYDFRNATSVPKLSNTNSFDGINGICAFIIPDTLYDEWINATNWVTYADYIYKASEVAA